MDQVILQALISMTLPQKISTSHRKSGQIKTFSMANTFSNPPSHRKYGFFLWQPSICPAVVIEFIPVLAVFI